MSSKPENHALPYDPVSPPVEFAQAVVVILPPTCYSCHILRYSAKTLPQDETSGTAWCALTNSFDQRAPH